jgi:putative endonuclease
MSFYTYILASGRNGTLYVGMTDDLEVRVMQHRSRMQGGFTAKYGVHTLVWYQTHDTREAAFKRERAIKKWRRAWKLEMIEYVNPGWVDLLPAFIADRDQPYKPPPLPPHLR